MTVRIRSENAGTRVWTPYRARLRWQGFLLGSGPKTEACCTERFARQRHITTSPQIALIIDEYHEDWGQLWYIMVRGNAKLIPRSAHQERAQVIRQLRAKYP